MSAIVDREIDGAVCAGESCLDIGKPRGFSREPKWHICGGDGRFSCLDVWIHSSRLTFSLRCDEFAGLRMEAMLVNQFVIFFVVVDPIGVALMFYLMTIDLARHQRRQIALRAVMISTVILLVFFFAGDLLLSLLGVGPPAFRIAGGILFFLLAIDMVFARQSGLRSTTASEQAEAQGRDDISVFPLAFPLISGPGAMTTVLLMASESRTVGASMAVVGIIIAVMALAFVALWQSHWLNKVLGETGSNVIGRLLGLILAALAVQYVIDGVVAVI